MVELIKPTRHMHNAWRVARDDWGPGTHEDGFGLLPSDEVDSHDRTSPPGRSPTERREAARRHELAVRRAARDREARLRGFVDDQGRPTAAPGPDEQARHADAVRAQLRAARSIPR